MICYIYRSTLKSEMYLYTITKDDYSNIPEALLKAFGRPEFSMVINLKKRDKLARVDINKVKEHLDTEGYYLQMPPPLYDDQNFLNPDED